MKRIIRIFVFVTFINVVFVCYAFADIINIPADYSTIQAGINAASNGDTVLVQPGTYVENINYNGKNITVGSLFITTADTSYISQTIIDGNQNGSVVTYINGEDSTATLTGFTLTNGCYDGGGIFCYNSHPILKYLNISNNFIDPCFCFYGGAGICFINSNASLQNSIIRDNVGYDCGGGIYCGESDIELGNLEIHNNTTTGVNSFGGGIFLIDSYLIIIDVEMSGNKSSNGGAICSSNSTIELKNVNIINNSASMSGGGISNKYDTEIIFSNVYKCNIYGNQISGKGAGSDIYSGSLINVIVDTFSVMYPTDYYTSPLQNFTFDINHGVLNQIDADLYVSPTGSNSNSGLTQDEPLQTIHYATSVIISDSLNPHTIYLAEGVYSPSQNDEQFPINVPDDVSLVGKLMDDVILDAENSARVLCLINMKNSLVSNLTIMNGNSDGGSGIYLSYSDVSLYNLIIKNNAGLFGSGIYNFLSKLTLDKVIVADNISDRSAGIANINSDLIIKNSSIINNAKMSGSTSASGIYCTSGQLEIINSIIADNSGGYGVYAHWTSGETEISYSNFWNNEEGNFYGLNDSIGNNVTTNANGDSCDIYYNIQENPLFVNPLDGDYHLSWANFPIPDSTMSPCIDAGDPTSPLDPDGTIADMGAYYFNQNVSVDDPQEMSNYMLTNYPNPIISNFNDLTVSFSIHKPGKVKIQLFNIKGQLVSTLINEEKNIGDYTISHTVNELSSGIYFTKMSIDGVDREIKKVVLLR